MRPDSTPLPADHRVNEARPILSPLARLELLLWIFVIVSAISILPRLAPAIGAWIRAHAEAVQTSALRECALPAEFEQVHIVVEHRAGRLAATCMYVGSKGTYAR